MVVFIDRDTQKVHNFPLEPATKKGVAKALQMFADALGENKSPDKGDPPPCYCDTKRGCVKLLFL